MLLKGWKKISEKKNGDGFFCDLCFFCYIGMLKHGRLHSVKYFCIYVME